MVVHMSIRCSWSFSSFLHGENEASIVGVDHEHSARRKISYFFALVGNNCKQMIRNYVSEKNSSALCNWRRKKKKKIFVQMIIRVGDAAAKQRHRISRRCRCDCGAQHKRHHVIKRLAFDGVRSPSQSRHLFDGGALVVCVCARRIDFQHKTCT